MPCDKAGRICTDVTETVGGTPMVYLNKVANGVHAQIACKVEFFGPTCSCKDRIAWSMIEDAEKKGLIIPGKSVVIEATSGNNGAALASVCAARGYKLLLVMPSYVSIERRTVARAFGAEIVLVDAALGTTGLLERLKQLLEWIPNAFSPNQFTNPANPLSHYENTGPEIWTQTEGKVDICVFGSGSGGTMSGVGRYLKEKNPNVQVYVVEPEESPVLSGGEPAVHSIQGIGASIIPETLDTSVYDEVLHVTAEQACEMSKRLAREEGLLVGISSGANVHAAIQIAKRPENAGKLIVTSLPSFGERYLTSCLYGDIREECVNMIETTIEQDEERITMNLKLSL